MTILLKQMNFTFVGIHVTMHNSPGLIMAVLWILLAILTVLFFHDLPTSSVRFPARTVTDPSPFASVQNTLKFSSGDRSFTQAVRRAGAICKKPVIIVSPTDASDMFAYEDDARLISVS